MAELVDSGADVLEAGAVEVEHLHNYSNSVHSCFSTAVLLGEICPFGPV